MTLIVGGQPSNKGAVGMYRLIQPLLKAHQDQELDVFCPVLDFNINRAQFEAMASQIDVYVFQYPQTEAQLKYIEFTSSDPKTLTVVEIDDTVWNMDARQERYALFGTREVKADGKYVYRDGVNGFDLKGNTKRLQYLTQCIMAADLVTVTTPKLKEIITKDMQAAGKKHPKIEVLPNCVDMAYYDPVQVVKDEIRIIWQGGDGHRHDLAKVAPALKEVLNKYPNVKMVFAANSWPEINKKLGEDRIITNHAWTSFDAHPYRLKLLGGDIGICPLEDTTFNEAKSEIKFTEYAALGIPVVASDIVTYSSVIKDGENGFLAKTTEEWVNRLCRLVESETLRRKIGDAGRSWVQRNRNADLTYKLWPGTYQKYLEIKT